MFLTTTGLEAWHWHWPRIAIARLAGAVVRSVLIDLCPRPALEAVEAVGHFREAVVDDISLQGVSRG